MKRTYGLLLAIFVVMLAGCTWYYQYDRAKVMGQIIDQLNAVATLKLDEVTKWREEQIREGRKQQQRPAVMARLIESIESPEPENIRWLRNVYMPLQTLEHFIEILALDTIGNVVWSMSETADPQGPATASLTRAVLETGEVLLSEVYFRGAPPEPRMDVVVPIFSGSNANKRPVGSLVLVSNIAKNLYPLLDKWPVPSKTAEVYLVQREGEVAQLITPAMHVNSGPAELQIDLRDNTRVASRGIKGNEVIIEGTDYRNVPVFSAFRPIPNSSWYLFAEIDLSEAQSIWREKSRLILLLFSALSLLPLMGGVLLWQSRQREVLQELNNALLEKQHLGKLHGMLSETNELLIRATSHEQLLTEITQIAVRDERFKFAWIGLPESDGRVRVFARAGEDSGYIDTVLATTNSDDPRGQGPTGQVLRSGIPVVTNDFLCEDCTTPWHEAARRAGIGGSLVLPLFHQGKVYGTINLYTNTGQQFSPDAVATLERVASNVSFGLDALSRDEQRLALLDSLGTALKIVEAGAPVLFRWKNEVNWPIEFVSENVRRWGYEAAQFLSGDLHFADILHPEDRQRVAEEVAEHVRQEHAEYIQIYRILSADGETHWVEDRSVMVRNAEGVVIAFSGIVHDITERVQTEELLRLQAASLEAAANGIVITDISGKIVWANSSFVTLTGYSVAESIGRNPGELLQSGEQDDAFYHEMWETILSGDVWRGELINRRKDGTSYNEQMTITPVKDGNGDITHFVAIKEDITAQKMAESLLRESETRFRGLIEDLDVAVFLHDVNDQIIICNHIATELFGIHAAEFSGLTSRDERWDLIRTDGTPLPAEEVPSITAVRTRKPVRNVVLGSRNLSSNTRIWLSVTANPRFDGNGNVENVLVTAVNITAEHTAEQALVRSRERLERAVAAGHIGLWDWDLATNAFEYTDEWCHQLGYERSELTGTIEDWFSRLHPEDRDKNLFDRDNLDAMPTYYTHEYRILHKDGNYRWHLGNVYLLRSEAGKTISMGGANVDITDRKRLEDEFRQAQRLESIGRLAGGVAHDFNNLLSVISGYTEMVLAEVPEGSSTHKDLLQVRHAAERAANLTRQLLAFSRRQVLRPKMLNLNSIIADAQKMLARLVGEDIVFEIALAENLWPIVADPGQLEQVLMNLVVNARDAMPYGGNLLIKTSNIEVAAEQHPKDTALQYGDYVMITVQDTGTGMDAATLQHLFEPFFTTKALGKGTGLGLATAYGIVQQSGGTIRVESTEGQGSTFSVYLPRLKEPSAHTDDRVPEDVPRGTETILLVEDEDALRTLTERILKSLGYQVLTAASGTEALTLLEAQTEKVPLLLTDVVMPGMNGALLAQQVLERDSDMRILYISGYTDDAISHYGVLDKGTHLLNKPFTAASLAKAIRAVLDGPAA